MTDMQAGLFVAYVLFTIALSHIQTRLHIKQVRYLQESWSKTLTDILTTKADAWERGYRQGADVAQVVLEEITPHISKEGLRILVSKGSPTDKEVSAAFREAMAKEERDDN